VVQGLDESGEQTRLLEVRSQPTDRPGRWSGRQVRLLMTLKNGHLTLVAVSPRGADDIRPHFIARTASPY